MASSSEDAASAGTLTINVPGWTEVTGHTEYIIKSSIGEHHFAVQHRFSNFIEVHEHAMRSRLTALARCVSQLPVVFANSHPTARASWHTILCC